MDWNNLKRTLLKENPPQLKRGERLQNLDVLKLISLVLVLCLHCSMEYVRYQVALWSIDRFIYCTGVLAIPVFFTVSGYQLLGRVDVGWNYAIIKILRVLKVTFIAYIVVDVVYCFLSWHTDFWNFPMKFAESLIQKGDFGLIWFMGAMMLVYLFYPLLNSLYNKSHVGFLWLSLGLLVVMNLFFIRMMVPSMDILPDERDIRQTFRLWNWLGYFCLGGLIKRYEIFMKIGKLSYIIVMIPLTILFMNLGMAHNGNPWAEFYYSSLPVYLLVAMIFSWIMRYKINNRFMAEMVLVFFPAYILGDFFLVCWRPFAWGLPWYMGTITFVALTAVCSVVAAWLLMKIPFVRKLLKF